ncbi:MAG: type II CRISPR RNA-guided endonuclease Cas9 [Flavobacteriales bacterium]|nr:type II CRISPR RNA-guided endonuclease Cas9 [Flavobacteriales bacterium]
MMEKKNELIVGLDVGSNSVGWAVVEVNAERLERIHAMGSRIIPMGPELKEYEEGKRITKNATRRQKRSMRRNHQRYKLRRAKLVQALGLIDAWPEGLGEHGSEVLPMLTSLQLYGLRAMAVDHPVTLPELGRILYHMNQRRGYKDIGDLMDEQVGAAPEAEKDDGKSIERVHIAKVEVDDAKGRKVKYLVTLADGREGTTTIATMKEMEGTEQELEVTTKETKRGTSIEFRLPVKTDWRKGMESLNQAIDLSGLTPGQFFHQALKDDPFYRIRERIVLRDTYKNEFDRIWARQVKAHARLADPVLRDRVVLALIPRNEVEQKKWLNRDLGTFIRDHVIYFQRPLKSQRSSKGQCRFEPQKPVMPVSSPIHQLFRIQQQVNNIRLIDRYGKEHDVSADERNLVLKHLLEHKELKPENLLKCIGRKEEPLENNLRAALPGHQTLAALRPRLKASAIWDRLAQEAPRTAGLQESLLFRIWHILYSIPTEEHRRKALAPIDGIPDDELEALAKVRFDRKHGAVSARAAMRLLPLMVNGDAWRWEDVPDRDQRRIQDVIDKVATGEEIERLPNEVRVRLTAYTAPHHFQGLPYWLAATVLYGDHRSTGGKPYEKPEEIRTMPRGFLRNPVVEQVVNEARMIVRDIWSTYGRPTSIRVELARELRQNQEQRKRTFDNNRKRDKERKEVLERLVNEFNRPKPSRKDIERYELWVQQEHRCMYSGNTIERTQLFDTRDTDVDHIIPRALYFDDSIQNRVLCLREENANKDKQLAALYMKAKGTGAWEAYVDRVNSLRIGRTKKKYLLAEEVPESFINRQLQETRYIGTKLTELLQPVCPVHSTLGIITDTLKNEWGLDKVFKEVLLPRFERLERITGRTLVEPVPGRNGHGDWRIEGYDKRIDHRHHALDALTVALTRQGYIQRLSTMNQLKLSDAEKEAMKRPTWYPLPHPDLRRLVKEQLERTIPSIKNRQRLLTKAANHTRHLVDPKTGTTALRKQTKGDLRAVRGPLHNEQPLGEVREQRKWPLKDIIAHLSERPDPLEAVSPRDPGEPGYHERFLAHAHEARWLHAHLSKYEGNVERMKKALRKDPLANARNERVDALTVLVPKYTITRNLGPTFTEKMVEKIIDTRVRQVVREHLKAHGNDPKKAFTDEALYLMNQGLKVPVRKVRCRMDEALVGEAMGRKRFLRHGDPNRKLHVEKGENHALAVFVNEATGERVFEVVPFFDAVERRLKGLDLVDARPGHRHFLLRKNDLVYVPRPGEDVRSIDWKDTEYVGDRVMRMTQMSGNRIYFLKAHISNVVTYSKEEMEFGSQNAAEFEDRDDPRTKISQVCVPIRMDRLGRVEAVPF